MSAIPSIGQIAASLATSGFGVVPLGDLETAAIINALNDSNGNRTYAARKLGISLRTLQRKLKVLGGNLVVCHKGGPDHV